MVQLFATSTKNWLWLMHIVFMCTAQYYTYAWIYFLMRALAFRKLCGCAIFDVVVFRELSGQTEKCRPSIARNVCNCCSSTVLSNIIEMKQKNIIFAHIRFAAKRMPKDQRACITQRAHETGVASIFAVIYFQRDRTLKCNKVCSH